MSKVTEARSRLELMVASFKAGNQPTHAWISGQLQEIIPMLTREPMVRRARPVSDPITPGKVKAVRDMAAAHDDWTFQALGTALNISSARVSEILSGKRNDKGELVE